MTYILIQSYAYKNHSLPDLTADSIALPIFQLRSDGYTYSDPVLSNMSCIVFRAYHYTLFQLLSFPSLYMFLNIEQVLYFKIYLSSGTEEGTLTLWENWFAYFFLCAY